MTKIERLRKNFASGMSEARISDDSWAEEFLPMLEDAERYRWLKEQGIVKTHVMTSLHKGDTRILAELYGGNTYVIKGSSDSLNAAIDSARKQTKEP